MLDISVSGYPNSRIEGARFIVRRYRSAVELPFASGTFVTHAFNAPATPAMAAKMLELVVQTETASVSALAGNVPPDAQIHLIGIDPSNFLCVISHPVDVSLAPTCQLRCTPTDPPVTGPGCISCRSGGLTFKVCC